MWGAADLRSWLVRLTTRRYRRMFIASVVTLATSLVLIGLVGFIQWRGHQAIASDTRGIVAQASEQLLRALQSRRGTLTFLRDTLNRQPTLSQEELRALGASAVEHTRHLLGTGMLRAAQRPTWWSGLLTLSESEHAQVNRAIARRTELRDIWRTPSTFVTTLRTPRTLLIMLEPLREKTLGKSAVVGVFDLNPLLEDFFTSSSSQPYPVQLLDGESILYRSPDWPTATAGRRPMAAVEHPINVDAARWTIHMQPASTRITQTLFWLNALLMWLSGLAGLGVVIIAWIVAVRTWVLQRAVQRRTAALRRTSERLRQMAITDELTGLHNRRFFLDRWEWEYERAKRYQRPLACLMVDVNGFKQVNDRLGHAAGDVVLKHVALELKTMLRQSDVLARFGGDEFIVALPETSFAQAQAVAAKLREVRIALPDAAPRSVPPISLSVGISRLQDQDDTSQRILEAADQSLYAWKRRTQQARSSPARPHLPSTPLPS